MLWKVKHGGWIVLFTPLPEVPQYLHLSILGRTVFRSEVGAKHNPPCRNISVDRVIIHDADKGLQWQAHWHGCLRALLNYSIIRCSQYLESRLHDGVRKRCIKVNLVWGPGS